METQLITINSVIKYKFAVFGYSNYNLADYGCAYKWQT